MDLFYIVIFLFFFLTCTQSRDFRYYPYREIMSIFEGLSETCSQYVKIEYSQERYGLYSQAKCGNEVCKTLIVFMTNFDTMNVERPQVKKLS